MVEYFYLITVLPLVGFLINGLFGTKIKNEKVSGIIGSITVLGSFIITAMAYFHLTSLPESSRSITIPLFNWITTGSLNISAAYLVDPLSVTMCLIITGVGFLIHVYAIGYMHGDRGFARFFAFLNLFIFAMLNLVLGDNLLLMFLGWEGVGLCSYLLIGFFYEKKFAGDAANKAFWVNRIGDFGFMLAMFFIFMSFGTLNFLEINAAIPASAIPVSMFTIITLLLFVGATGKSAQIPLFVWLPDAMAGPTPVSALIHAATMVTAGVYMIGRTSLLFANAPATMEIVMVIGALTAFMSATIAVAQNDIKKILAYSTVSQLGFMFMAMGAGAFSTGIFHVTTHAFFKALMFLAAGSVIHGMHDEQDVTKMGGLKSKMKVTFLTFLMGAIAISGIPPFSGFFSKDEILSKLFFSGHYPVFGLAVLTAFMTAFYVFRLISLTFYGKPRYDESHVHPHESPALMTVPLIILAVLSVVGGFIGMPHIIAPNFIEHWLEPVFGQALAILPEHHVVVSTEIGLIAFSILVAVIAILVSLKMFKTGEKLDAFSGGFYSLLRDKYRVDELYDKIIVSPLLWLTGIFYKIFDVKVIDGAVNGTARFFNNLSLDWRKLQTGIVQDYALFSIAGIIAILLYILLR
ncbi:MAG: NADH dehydrogenase I subunit L [Chlorobi bacterium OLB5]|nr:MAG: NADH dehydrogenase I subunit L [Chlorobi bacterium OLB5]